MRILKTAMLTDNKTKVKQVLDSETKMKHLQALQASNKIKFKMVKFDKLILSQHKKSIEEAEQPGELPKQPITPLDIKKQVSSPSLPMSLATSLSLENFGEFSASKMGASSGKAQKLS
mmetsp:Transcript_27089/g.41251  ORF Transcript_27089/g.41251 Transcript_27089/m.41251 type:complete len:118 (+) Transcript_27089:86-439(+)